MRTMKKLSAILLFLFLCSCEGNSPENKPAEGSRPKNKLIGTWELVEFAGRPIRGEEQEPIVFTDDGKLFGGTLFPFKNVISYSVSGKDSLLLSAENQEPAYLAFSIEENLLNLKFETGEIVKIAKLRRKPESSDIIQPSDETAIIGRWKEIDGSETIEFFKGGTVSIVDRGKSTAGDYRFLDVGRLRFDLGGIGAVAGPMIFSASIIGDKLILTDANGKATKYTRIR
jgi:hypothetical protein